MAASDSAALESSTVGAGIADGVSSAMRNGRQDESNVAFALEIQKKYEAERDKRIKAEGSAQYLELAGSEKFKHMQNDPWLDQEPPIASVYSVVPDLHCKILISGAGFGGLAYAVRLIQAGVDPDDIRMIDAAGGFGGTWYWNRYPGLMCDVESYIYLPLLEEMNYMPKHKYSYGPELRRYANMIADKWGLRSKTMFQTALGDAKWDEGARGWLVDISQNRRGHEKLDLQIRSQILIIASGVLNHPKIPRLPGLSDFKGHTFHTARWDYAYTGGTPESPALENLRSRRIGIIGTGATAIQVVPELAKWAKELYVFQRTPSSVDERGQRPTDPKWWAQETENKPGWQKRRNDNFMAHIADIGPTPDTNLVGDGWSTMPSYSALVGSPTQVTPESVPTHIANLHAIDLPRQERVRSRVDAIVQDPATAASLKAYYPSWCKRPCFHDDYLQCFNQPNVHLIDTDGKGLDGLTSTAAIANGKEYGLDVLIFSTGFRTPTAGAVVARANARVTGKGGQDFEMRFEKDGTQTLHGIITSGFPNFFFPGLSQAGATPNYTHMVDQYATQAAYILSESFRRAGTLPTKPHSSQEESETSSAQLQSSGAPKKVIVEATAAACQAWTGAILQRAASLAAVAGCTPSYFNENGDATGKTMSPEEQMKAATRATWGDGMRDYIVQLEKWRKQGDMEGVEVLVEA